jgi:hypothetical protein
MPKPKKTPDIIAAIKHPNVFGSLLAFQSLETWRAWLVWFKAVFALPMDDNDLVIYRQCTGRTEAPNSAPIDVYTIVGRHGGKSFMNDEDSTASGFNARYHVADKPLLPVPYEPIYIGSTLTTPWASVLAQNSQGGVQILAAFQ